MNTYTTAVQRLRNASIRVPIVIDAPDFGKNLTVVIAGRQPVAGGGPATSSSQSTRTGRRTAVATPTFIETQLQAARQAGMALVLGELSEWGAFNGNRQHLPGQRQGRLHHHGHEGRRQGLRVVRLGVGPWQRLRGRHRLVRGHGHDGRRRPDGMSSGTSPGCTGRCSTRGGSTNLRLAEARLTAPALRRRGGLSIWIAKYRSVRARCRGPWPLPDSTPSPGPRKAVGALDTRDERALPDRNVDAGSGHQLIQPETEIAAWVLPALMDSLARSPGTEWPGSPSTVGGSGLWLRRWSATPPPLAEHTRFGAVTHDLNRQTISVARRGTWARKGERVAWPDHRRYVHSAVQRTDNPSQPGDARPVGIASAVSPDTVSADKRVSDARRNVGLLPSKNSARAHAAHRRSAGRPSTVPPVPATPKMVSVATPKAHPAPRPGRVAPGNVISWSVAVHAVPARATSAIRTSPAVGA